MLIGLGIKALQPASVAFIILKSSFSMYFLIGEFGVLDGLFCVINTAAWSRYYGRKY